MCITYMMLLTQQLLQVTLSEPDVKKVNVPVPLSFGTVSLNSNNNLEWVAHVPADTKQSITLSYAVEYPPEEVVEGLP